MTSLDNFVIRTPFWWTPPGCADGGTEAAMLPKGFAFEIKIPLRGIGGTAPNLNFDILDLPFSFNLKLLFVIRKQIQLLQE
jgi:nitrogen-specific signal transduction histidine kinase